MEKLMKGKFSINKISKLPTLPESKHHFNSTKLYSPQKMSSTQRLKDLKKLYFQYRTNANILVNSPYYTNRHQQKKVVQYINMNKFELNPQKQEEIVNKFKMAESQNSLYNEMKKKEVIVKLLVLDYQYSLTVEARCMGELFHILRKQFALKEYRMNGNILKAQSIIAFQTTNDDYITDYQLSLKMKPIMDKLSLRPLHSHSVKNKVRLSNFKFIHCLGSGGFSLVYLVRDKFKGQFYALKLIDKQFIISSERQTIVENQRYVLGQLRSSFVTELKFCFETKNHFAFLIEYCPGGQLFYQLKKVKRMTEDQAKFYFLQILIGLDYIHSKNIIYRDLKPENLMIAADGHVKIADFGLAKPLTQRNVAYSFCGSPQYMAPEMLLKTGHSCILDYYCLGSLLYELVLGIPPFYSLNHDEIYDGILNQKLTFPSHTPLSDEIKSLLRGLLQKNPAKRLGSLHGVKQILIHPWIGRINRKEIEQKRLIPPFFPDLQSFNFDESELKEKALQMSSKIQQDLKNPKFETYFSQQFYFQCQSFPKHRLKLEGTRIRKLRGNKSNSKQNRNNIRSVDTHPHSIKRNFSQGTFR